LLKAQQKASNGLGVVSQSAQSGTGKGENMKTRVPILLLLVLFSGSIARADPIVYTAFLNGMSENPPTGSGGVGLSIVSYDPAASTLSVVAGFANLIGTVTAAHIHCCVDPPMNTGVATAVPTFPDFPMGVTFGAYSRLFDLTDPLSFNPSFVSANGGTALGAEMALAAGLAQGRAYFNIHTTEFSGGEIRGFLNAGQSPAPIPEPATLALIGSGVGLLAAARRRKRSV
jgi:hypothetical protein